MAGPLTEVVFEASLPDGAMRRLSKDTPEGRIVLTPVAINGTGWPHRFLASAMGFAAVTPALDAALATLLDERRPLDGDGQTRNTLGDLAPAARTALEGLIGEAFGSSLKDAVNRPVLIKDGWVSVSLVLTDEGPIEPAVSRLCSLLKARGLTGRLVRMGPYHPERQPLGTYEEALTPKQTEILRMALALGLYDTPRRCTLDTLAEIFGISKAAAHNRMKGAERKILSRFFE